METMLVEQWAKMKNRRIKTTNDGQQSEAETFNGRIYIYVCMSLDQQLSIVTVDMKIMYGHAKYSLQLHFKDHNNFLDY